MTSTDVAVEIITAAGRNLGGMPAGIPMISSKQRDNDQDDKLIETAHTRLVAAGFAESEATGEWCDRACYGNGVFINVAVMLTEATITNQLDTIIAQLRTYSPKMFYTSMSIHGVHVSAWHATRPFTRETCGDEQEQTPDATE